jgi:manganese/zinc/iron transport system ATP- binding protein
MQGPLVAHGLSVVYDGKPALWNVDFAAPAGALVGVIGPNGAGKSSFIKAALGLVPIASGWVTLLGEVPKKSRGRVGYVPQRASVDWDFPASALDVVAMGFYRKLGWLRPVGRKTKAAARDCLAQVGMADLADRPIGQLSGGQQQRVFLARALAQDADLYMMDEPFAGVDAASEGVLISALRSLQAAGKTVLVVHHDLQTAPDYFDHALILATRAVACGPIAEVFTAKTLQEAYGGRLAPSQLAALAAS